jgi:ABC-type transport system involved in multi-copper enzyme maturation permease subunit
MNAVLLGRSLRDSWLLLVSCSLLSLGFTWLRVWVASHIKVDAFVKFFSESLQVFQALLPVSIEELASPLGRVAFSFEEFGLLMLLGLWTVTRATDCLAGRIGAGTMEMLLAQPIRRLTLVSTHTAITLLGVLAIGLASWIGVRLGLEFSKFEQPPDAMKVAPAAVNFLCLGVFITGAATLIAALVRSRSQAVGLVIAFYVVQLTLMIIGRLNDQFSWMNWLTILSVYEPTLLTIGLNRDPSSYWPLFWQYNGCLLGLGAATLALSAAIFCHRDVPAPL